MKTLRSRFAVIFIAVFLFFGLSIINGQPVNSSQASAIAKNFYLNHKPGGADLFLKSTELQDIELNLVHEESDLPERVLNTWSLPAGWTGSSTSTSITVTAGSNNGNVSVRANNACGSGPERTLSVTALKVPSQPATITGEATVCSGSTQIYNVSAVSGANSYTWVLPSGWTGSSTTTSLTATAGTSGGTVSVTASNACGTSTARTVNVSVVTTPAQPGTISGSAEVCEASTQIYSVEAVTAATSYVWTLPSGWTGSSTTASITTTIGENGGTLSVAAKNACGTGSLKSIDVVVKEKPATPVIVLNTGNVLHSDAAAGNQWLKQKAAIAGAVSQDYSVTANGDYSVIVSLNGCSSDTSNVIKVTVTGLNDLGSDKTIKLYPNPVTNELIIEIEGNREEIKYEIINTAGQIVISGILVEKEIIQTTNLSKGMYIVKLNNNDIIRFEKVLKE